MRLALAPARRPRIALTSLIDVVFLLLFFFMLASRALDWRALSVDLASLRGAPVPTQTVPSPVLVLMADGRVMLRGESIARDALLRRVGSDAAREWIVVPARGVSLQLLMDLIDPLHQQGVAVRLSHPGLSP